MSPGDSLLLAPELADLPPELLAALLADPHLATVEIDREIVARERMRGFVPLAWHAVEAEGRFVGNWHIDAICDHLQAVSAGQIQRLMIAVPPRHMKALDSDTPILTTWGWKRHGDLEPGDFVFGPDGSPKRVTACTGEVREEALEVRFDDGAAIVAGQGHLWEVERDVQGAQRYRKRMVVATPFLRAAATKKRSERSDAIALTAPVLLPPRRLLIDPYVLGAWLGDGASGQGCIYVAEQDIDHFAGLGEVRKTSGGSARGQAFYRVTVPSLSTRLRVLGLLGNKHIPEDFLESSVEQRWELLRGLMDTDGNCTRDGQCRFTNANRNLIEQARRLMWSLGLKPGLTTRSTTLNGRTYGPHYALAFTPRPGDVVFGLARKQERLDTPRSGTARARFVESVTPVGPRVVKCIEVEGGLYLAGRELVPTHNSLLTAVFWPAWDWIDRPDRRWLFASYAQSLSTRDSVKCRRVLQSPWYQARWGDRFRFVDDQNQKQRFENDRHGYRLSTSVDGALTGEGGDIIVVDDPHNVRQGESEAVREETLKWWDEAMSTRLNDPKTGAYVVIQQRVHERDLVGHILAKVDQAKPWTYLCLPAEYDPGHKHVWIRDPRQEPGGLLWPEHMPREELEERKAALGPYASAAQYQQSPAPREGGLFKRAWFGIIEVPPGDVDWVRAWDLAASEAKATKSDPDWTATVKLGHSRMLDKYVIAHGFRTREDPHQVRQLMKQFAEVDGKRTRQAIPQDPGQAGKAQARQIAMMLSGWSVAIEIPSGDKWTRAMGFAAQAAAGNVVLVRGDWNQAYLDELCGFPTGSHDDWVDATSTAFNALMAGHTGALDYARQVVAQQESARAAEAALAERVKAEGTVGAEVQTSDLSLAAARAALLGMGKTP